MPEISYIPDPRAGDTPASREYDCDCAGGSGGSGATGPAGPAGPAGPSSGFIGAGSPEGAQVADPGATYFNTTDSTFWVKETGTGTNTGWAQLL